LVNEYWRILFPLPAQNRYNRFNLVFEQVPEPSVVLPISQVAVNYGIDFMLGLTEPGYEPLKSLLGMCLAIRSVQLTSVSDDAKRAISEAGRRVALELRGAPGSAEMEITKDFDRDTLAKWGRQSWSLK